MLSNHLPFLVIALLDQYSCGRENKNSANSITAKSTIPDTSQIKNQSLEKHFLKIRFEIIVKESVGKLKIGLSLVNTIELLGVPELKGEPELWDADGEYHQMFSYKMKGIDVDIIGESNSLKKVGAIVIQHHCEFKTMQNIGIGSSFAEVKTTYSNKINLEDSHNKTIIVGSIYGGLIFTFKDDKVESIVIGSMAE